MEPRSMSLFTPSLRVAADVLDLAAELAGALAMATEGLVIAALDEGHVGVVSVNDDPGEAVAVAVASRR
jgi:hypothetical protein